MSEPRYDLKPSPGSHLGPTIARARRTGQDPYRYGWRTLWEKRPDGGEKSRVVPLTYEDLLDPQLGDQMTQDSLHIELVALLMGLLKKHFAPDPEVGVFGDLKVIFDVPGLPGPGPDVLVVRGVRDRDRRRTSFRVGEEPGRVVLVIEVVSPDYRDKDYRDLYRVYEQAGVAEYLTVEALGEYLNGPYRLAAHRLGDDRRYHPIEPDVQGRLHLETVGLSIAPDPEGWGLELADRATGQRLLTPEEQAAAESKRAAEEARARKALEARLARLEQELERRSEKL